MENLNSYLTSITLAVGILSILMVWIYMYELFRGIDAISAATINMYVTTSYVFSIVMLSLLWITTEGIEEKLVKCFSGLSIGWFITAAVPFVVTAFVPCPNENKKKIRNAALAGIIKTVCLAGVLWLIY